MKKFILQNMNQYMHIMDGIAYFPKWKLDTLIPQNTRPLVKWGWHTSVCL